MPIITRENLADASLLFVALIWGSTFIITKQALAEVPTFAFLTIRFSLSALILSVVAIPRINRCHRSVLSAGIILGTALFLTFAFQTLGLNDTTASAAGFITGLNVIIVPVLSTLLIKKPPRPASVVGVIFSGIGLYLVTLSGSLSVGKGEFLILLCAVAISAHIVMTDRFARKHDVVVLTTIQICVVAILSLVASLTTEQSQWPEAYSAQLISAFFITSILATVAALWIQTAAQKYTTPTKAAIIFAIEPVSSAFFSFWLGGEMLTVKQYSGAALIIVAMLWAELAPRVSLNRDNKA